MLHYWRALSRKPQSPVAYSNLAGALRAERKLEEALAVVTRGLTVAETDDLKALFALCVQGHQSAPKIDKLTLFVERAMVQCWTRPNDLATIAALLVKQAETVRSAITRVQGSTKRLSAQELFGARGLAALAGDSLLLCLLESSPVLDITLERLLANVRRAVLDLATNADKGKVPENVLRVCCALAQQCFINEYIYDDSGERQRVLALRDTLAAALNSGAAIAAVTVAAVAAVCTASFTRGIAGAARSELARFGVPPTRPAGTRAGRRAAIAIVDRGPNADRAYEKMRGSIGERLPCWIGPPP